MCSADYKFCVHNATRAIQTWYFRALQRDQDDPIYLGKLLCQPSLACHAGTRPGDPVYVELCTSIPHQYKLGYQEDPSCTFLRCSRTCSSYLENASYYQGYYSSVLDSSYLLEGSESLQSSPASLNPDLTVEQPQFGVPNSAMVRCVEADGAITPTYSSCKSGLRPLTLLEQRSAQFLRKRCSFARGTVHARGGVVYSAQHTEQSWAAHARGVWHMLSC